MTIFRCEVAVKLYTLAIVSSLILLLVGCSEASGDIDNGVDAARAPAEQVDQKLCEDAVRGSLMNPETFEAFDFLKVSPGDAEYIDPIISTLGNRDIRQYRIRYKAASKVGLTVTTIGSCNVSKPASSNDEYCSCIELQ